MSVEWRRLKAVVIESDDWGLCAWAPDDTAARALAGTPVWRSPAGRRYGRTTLESASEVAALAELLASVHGADGEPAVLQANTVMASPDYAAIAASGFDAPELPLLSFPLTPPRWSRPGLWDAVRAAIDRGVWWPELHGLHHMPAAAWLESLRRGDADARVAFEHETFVCGAVQSSGEYDRSEPESLRGWNLRGAVDRFVRVFGRLPGSLCPPDYRWDPMLERDAEALGVTTIQGRSEKEGRVAVRLRRTLDRMKFPHTRNHRFYMPPRIAFEPRGEAAPAGPTGIEHAVRGVRDAWRRGQPAILSTHRAGYAHLDAAWSERGRRALGALLTRLAAEGATFLVDYEVRSLAERGWSVRPIGPHGLVVRSYASVRRPFLLPVPEGVAGVTIDRIAPAPGAGRTREPEARLEPMGVTVVIGPGSYRLLWRRA